MVSDVRYFWENTVNILSIKMAWEKAFSKPVTDKYWCDAWKWRFSDNPMADRTYAAYICDGDEIVSFVAFSPMFIRSYQKQHKAALGIIGFTNPDYQGKGYYSVMYNTLADRMYSEGFEVLLGFDNHNSHYPEVKHLHWKDIGLLTNFCMRDNDSKPLADLSSELTMADQDLSDDLLGKLALFHTNNSQFSVQRDFEFLKWRLMEHPHNRYRARALYRGTEILACVIYKLYGDNECDIMEMFYVEADEFEINKHTEILMRGMLSNKVKLINIWSQLQSSEHLLLEKIGFKESCFNAYFVCNPINIDLEILDIRKWHYRFMDSDVY